MSCPGMQETCLRPSLPRSLGERPPCKAAGLRLEAWDSRRGGERPEEKRDKRKRNGEDAAWLQARRSLRGSGSCLILERRSFIMAIDNPGLWLGLEDIDYFGIGIGAELAAPNSQRARSQSPGGLSISLEPSGKTGDFLYKGDADLLRFRRSTATSLYSVIAGDEAPFKDVVPEEKDVRQVEQPDNKYPATPVASSSTSLSTTPTFTGPLESYLTCPQSHEKRALSLSRDDDREQSSIPSDTGSLVMGPGDSRLGYLMERYLASEEDGEFLEDRLGHMRSEQGNDDTPNTPRLEPETDPPSGDAPFVLNPSIAPTTGPSTGNVNPIAGMLGDPIEVGHDRQSPDSGIFDMEADELHHLL
ncbi:uncharacterized protein GLRG_08544 [Colletotrichum graminicola M1.001]|uniref:Uncharacterized protein n=1 Tax=Colletotrichum graminicola (strain M1.001 / M2 / FGSC 10212) TaxID=645133 RepID=E3QRX7_COLGM|nr:uncharacterized protein GLRG_08544 [Colletotrichum graminicola M1.001]EFQ33615.1 hypothetical protein GLRG_08544 [Colletotrichum graminicola M1.001]